ncbi:UDP-N-acetylmuramoyl-tripeptide--D-alanyl-D-alanine ligase [Nocardioides marmorisolisilvae]|uniref:UDP-N-acetylmuramoyl-tripeptide--D-alanyl-D-alanine ligase n=1 Tax=Nocardioides marmorisolisilvae TaxID=1542737 RepID=A0A3N0DW51_9ACTN|nr:UDP-N-acetylmuramoyl-tripeptide--D-alanyl-D-alanine ligase [Nocardioides marmorisolisilvae]RNL79726.1 UDP-N-acetylmuramoyl-tripeptide--D-alanyl-D-alanine ligase [Nocardioides marmorisolisilvae]
MIEMTLGEIAEVVGGALADSADAGVAVTGPAFLDSRSPEPGGLFLAIAGEHVDGHDYAVGAVGGGAAAVLGSRATEVPTVVVDDVEAAVQALAREVLRRLRRVNPDLRVVAVTGSQGKTTAKDMLAAVLGDAGETVATYGSFNNELGLPITVLRTGPTTRFLVLEMGARGIGHLALLCAIAPPDVSLVLNVGRAHIGEFGSQEAIATAKGELVEALGPEGTAVLNHDDPLVIGMAPRTRGRLNTFGRTSGAAVQLEKVELDDLGRPSFDLHRGAERVHVRLNLLGEHQATNAVAAATVGLTLGLSLSAIGASLESITALSKWRMELHERADGLVVINDAYNANPDSMRAALETLAAIGRSSGRPTVAVLGEMRELGATSAQEHAAIGRLVGDLGIDRLVVVGEGARAISDTDESALFSASVSDAVEAVRNNVDGTEIVLVKASRAAGLERVADALLGAAPDVVGKEASP